METPAASFPSSVPTAAAPTPPPEGWAVPAGHGAQWWGDAWRLFTGAAGTWLLITVVWLAIMIGLSIIPFLGQIAVSLLHPVFIGGLILGCREQDRGGALKVSHLFAGFSEKLGPLVILALLYIVGWMVVACITFAVGLITLGGSILALLAGGDTMQAGTALLGTMGLSVLLVILVGLLFALPLLMAFWFAPALIVLRGDGPWDAMMTSFRACLRNIPPFLIWGLLGLAFAILASIPLGLGFLVLFPVGTATVYTSYKEIFGVPA